MQSLSDAIGERSVAEADAVQSDIAEVGSDVLHDGGAVTATLYKLSATEPIHVVLDPDASIGQLVVRLKQVMLRGEFSLLGRRASVILLGDAALLGDEVMKWELSHAYTKIMLTAPVQNTLRLGQGSGIQFEISISRVDTTPVEPPCGPEAAQRPCLYR